jgi:hypothetical protein
VEILILSWVLANAFYSAVTGGVAEAGRAAGAGLSRTAGGARSRARSAISAGEKRLRESRSPWAKAGLAAGLALGYAGRGTVAAGAAAGRSAGVISRAVREGSRRGWERGKARGMRALARRRITQRERDRERESRPTPAPGRAGSQRDSAGQRAGAGGTGSGIPHGPGPAPGGSDSEIPGGNERDRDRESRGSESENPAPPTGSETGGGSGNPASGGSEIPPGDRERERDSRPADPVPEARLPPLRGHIEIDHSRYGGTDGNAASTDPRRPEPLHLNAPSTPGSDLVSTTTDLAGETTTIGAARMQLDRFGTGASRHIEDTVIAEQNAEALFQAAERMEADLRSRGLGPGMLAKIAQIRDACGAHRSNVEATKASADQLAAVVGGAQQEIESHRGLEEAVKARGEEAAADTGFYRE